MKVDVDQTRRLVIIVEDVDGNPLSDIPVPFGIVDVPPPYGGADGVLRFGLIMIQRYQPTVRPIAMYEHTEDTQPRIVVVDSAGEVAK